LSTLTRFPYKRYRFMLPGSTSRSQRPKLSLAAVELRRHLGLTQPRFATLLLVSTTSVAHLEIGSRKPDATTVVRCCRAAHAAGRIDLAEIFAAAIPGVAEGLVVPVWVLAQSEPKQADQLQTAVEESTRPVTRWETILETMNVKPAQERA
jgi:hypothetical protein